MKAHSSPGSYTIRRVQRIDLIDPMTDRSGHALALRPQSLPQFLLLFTLGLVLWPAQQSHAQTAEAREYEPPMSAEDRAFALFEESQEHYNAGDFDEAATLLEQAYAIHPEPVLLYNLGRAKEGRNDAAGAIEAYRTFLEQSPDTEDRGAIEARIASLQSGLDERSRAEDERRRLEQEREAAEARARTSSQTGRRAGAWILAATGAVALGTGALLGVLSNRAEEQAQNTEVHLEATRELDRAENLSLGANIAFAGGGALLLTGVTWLLVSSLRDDDEDGDEPTMQVDVGINHLAVRGTF